MNIEVTNATFYTVIKGSTNFIKTVKGESSAKHYYYNEELEQGGIIVYNYTGSQTLIQHYLTDINA